MGLYNPVDLDGPCRRCGQLVARTVQIKYGECGSHTYRLGDSVHWGTGSRRTLNRGREAQARAWVPAYSDPCPNCHDESDFADFAVMVDGSRIEGFVQAPVGTRFREDQEVVPLDPDGLPEWEALPTPPPSLL